MGKLWLAGGSQDRSTPCWVRLAVRHLGEVTSTRGSGVVIGNAAEKRGGVTTQGQLQPPSPQCHEGTPPGRKMGPREGGSQHPAPTSSRGQKHKCANTRLPSPKEEQHRGEKSHVACPSCASAACMELRSPRPPTAAVCHPRAEWDALQWHPAA